MDEMKLRLSTRFMRSIVAKLISKAIQKKYGYKVNVQLNELDIRIIDGETRISTNVEAHINSKEFMKILKDIGLDD